MFSRMLLAVSLKANNNCNSCMNDFPIIMTARTVMQVPDAVQAPLLAGFRNRNRTHLAPWEPVREESYYSREAALRWIEDARHAFIEGRAVHFCAIDPATGDIAAVCNFSNIVRSAFQACHLGYAVDYAYQGTGLMHEVAQAGIDYMFNVLGLHRIMANYMPTNERSARLLERLGFEREGRARAYLRIAGRWEDHVLTACINPRV